MEGANLSDEKISLKSIVLITILVLFVISTFTTFACVLSYAGEIKANAERAHTRIDAIETSLVKIDGNVESIMFHLMGNPKKK